MFVAAPSWKPRQNVIGLSGRCTSRKARSSNRRWNPCGRAGNGGHGYGSGLKEVYAIAGVARSYLYSVAVSDNACPRGYSRRASETTSYLGKAV